MPFKCVTCGATYEPIGVDGVAYFHACAPLAVWEVRKLIDENASPLTTAQTRELAYFDSLPLPDDPPANYEKPGDMYLRTLAVPRPYARDENIDRDKHRRLADESGKLPSKTPRDRIIKAPGRGVLVVED